MAGRNRQIALKPYLDTIEGHCSQLSRDELIQLVLSLARDESTSGRALFLDRLKIPLPGHGNAKRAWPDIESLLEDIQALRESILERIEAVANGDYEAMDDWDWEDAHYDDEPEMIRDDQLDDLAGLFDTAGNLFLGGELRDARQLYQALFDLLKELKRSDYVMPELDIEIREERARYARCVYEISDAGLRLKKFADAMDIGVDASFRFDKQLFDDTYPLLQDVMDAGEHEMKGIQDFFLVWENFLDTKEPHGRPASLLLEVVYFTRGLAGVEKLAQKWGDSQPYGYLFWLEKLRQDEQWKKIIDIAREALAVLTTGQAREKISDFLAEAGKMASDTTIVLQGSLEKFYSHPCDANLKAFLAEAVQQEQREESLAQALDFFARQKELRDSEKSLYLKALLSGGQLDRAWEIVKGSKSLGWSYGVTPGLVFGSICAVTAGFHEDAETIRRLLTWYCGKSAVFSYQLSVEKEDQAVFFRNEIIRGLRQTRLQTSVLKPYTDWAFLIGRDRVDGIVSNKHRSAYQRAAWVLGSLAEIHAARGKTQNTRSLIEEYCKEKYNRHTAFRREVRQVISDSPLLRQSGSLM